jgi:hypothetical protein
VQTIVVIAAVMCRLTRDAIVSPVKKQIFPRRTMLELLDDVLTVAAFGTREEKFILAVKYGKLRQVQRFVRDGANVTVRDQYVSTSCSFLFVIYFDTYT